MIPKAEKQAVYTAFEPLEHASLALNFLTQMTDPALDGLPYGLFAPLNNPPFAEHNRIDDAELAKQAERLGKSGYGQYLIGLLRDKVFV